MIHYIHPDGRIENIPYRKFSTGELMFIFGGGFTLCCVDREEQTDLYMCSLDTHGMNINELQKYNELIKQMYGRDVYGLAISKLEE